MPISHVRRSIEKQYLSTPYSGAVLVPWPRAVCGLVFDTATGMLAEHEFNLTNQL
jgi:hypothetical protein